MWLACVPLKVQFWQKRREAALKLLCGKLCVHFHSVAVRDTSCTSDFWPNLNFSLEHQNKTRLNRMISSIIIFEFLEVIFEK